jgi:hypothetical protein
LDRIPVELAVQQVISDEWVHPKDPRVTEITKQ